MPPETKPRVTMFDFYRALACAMRDNPEVANLEITGFEFDLKAADNEVTDKAVQELKAAFDSLGYSKSKYQKAGVDEVVEPLNPPKVDYNE